MGKKVMSEARPPNFSSVWADLRGVTFRQHFVDVEGIRTRCIESGDPSKPLVLVLHGVGGHAEAYSRNFGPHGDHFWFVAIDMLGHGWTDKPAINYQVKDYAGHVLAVLKTLGRVKAMISGESLGGVRDLLALFRRCRRIVRCPDDHCGKAPVLPPPRRTCLA
jgi:2-hydroxy-6-oxonona-2,4-dienedioate hydrolase